MKQISIIGAGNWGTALAVALARKGRPVRLWGYEPEVVQSICERRENSLYMPGISIPASVSASGDLDEVLRGADIVLTVMPSHVCRSLFEQMVEARRLGHRLVEGRLRNDNGVGGEAGQPPQVRLGEGSRVSGLDEELLLARPLRLGAEDVALREEADLEHVLRVLDVRVHPVERFAQHPVAEQLVPARGYWSGRQDGPCPFSPGTFLRKLPGSIMAPA